VRVVLPADAKIGENAVAGADHECAAARTPRHQAFEFLGQRFESGENKAAGSLDGLFPR
jgi:hypothetical protein